MKFLLITIFLSLAYARLQNLTISNPCVFEELRLTGERRGLLERYTDDYVIEIVINITVFNSTQSNYLRMSLTPEFAISTYLNINPSQAFYNQFKTHFYGSFRDVKKKSSKEIDANFKYYVNICAEFGLLVDDIMIYYDYEYEFLHKVKFNIKTLSWIIPLCILTLVGPPLFIAIYYDKIKSKWQDCSNKIFAGIFNT